MTAQAQEAIKLKIGDSTEVLKFIIDRETEKAFLLSRSAGQMWVPKSAIKNGELAEWFCKKDHGMTGVFFFTPKNSRDN